MLFDYNLAVLAVVILITSLGFLAPFMYAKDRAVEVGFASVETGSYLISIIGVGSTIGRLLFGSLGDIRCLRPALLHLLTWLTIGAGAITMLCIFIKSYWHMAVYGFM